MDMAFYMRDPRLWEYFISLVSDSKTIFEIS